MLNMPEDILPADRNLRRKLFIWMALITIGILLITPTFDHYLEEIKNLSEENRELGFRKAIFLLKLTLGLISLILTITGLYLITIAIRTSKSNQYPPPGMRVIKDTRIRRGNEARWIVYSMISLSCILILFAHLLFFYFPNALEKKFIP